VAADFRIEYEAHRAVEDARAAGEVVLRAIADTGLSVLDWLAQVKRPILATASLSGAAYEANKDGPLYGEVVCFTGALQVPRREAAAWAAAAGCEVAAGVTNRTTLLIVGDQDARKLAGHETSSKHRKAEHLVAQGLSIRIVTEQDFRRLAAIAIEA
jgi:DNA polymerase III subunit epsilon